MKESGSFFVRQNLIASDPRFAYKDTRSPAAHDSSRRGARRAVARQIPQMCHETPYLGVYCANLQVNIPKSPLNMV